MREINHQLVTIKRRLAPATLDRPQLREPVYFSSPWLAVFIAVLLVGVISYFFRDAAESESHYRVLIYAVVGALITASGGNVLFLRFLLLRKAALPAATVKSSLTAGLLVIAFAAFVASGALLYAWDMPLSQKIFIILFFVLLSCSLTLFIIHSALTYFPVAAGIYFVLLMLMPGAGLAGKLVAGPMGFFLGLALAQSIVFFIQWFVFSHQFGYVFSLKKDLLSFARRDPGAILIGLLLAFGLFADKLVVWILGAQPPVFPFFQASFSVNTAFSLAFAFVLPAFVYFLLGAEKELKLRYRDFYDSLSVKATLAVIDGRKEAFAECLLRKASAVLKILLSCVFVFTYFATQIYAILGLDLEDVPLFRIALWGNALYVIFTCLVLVLYFTEWNRAVILLYGLFAFLNAILAVLNTVFFQIHPMYIFPAVCLISLLCAAAVSVYYFNNFLEMHFRRPPLGYQFRAVKDEECWVELLKDGQKR